MASLQTIPPNRLRYSPFSTEYHLSPCLATGFVAFDASCLDLWLGSSRLRALPVPPDHTCCSNRSVPCRGVIYVLWLRSTTAV